MPNNHKRCPKCGGPFDEQVRYCNRQVRLAPNETPICGHGSPMEHLFNKCGCGYENINVRPCVDAEKPE